MEENIQTNEEVNVTNNTTTPVDNVGVNNNTGNGAKENAGTERGVSSKNRLTAMVLCILLGFFGVHRLYAGKIGSGFLMAYGTIVSILATCVNVPMGLMCLITMAAFVANDFAALAFGQFIDVHGKYMSSNELH